MNCMVKRRVELGIEGMVFDHEHYGCMLIVDERGERK